MADNSHYKNNAINLNLSQTVNIVQEDTGLRERNSFKKLDISDHSNGEKAFEEISFEEFFLIAKKLIKNNKEIMLILIFIIILFSAMTFEFFYGLSYGQVDIISDSFFNMFKTLSFVITALSILFSKYFNFKIVFKF